MAEPANHKEQVMKDPGTSNPPKLIRNGHTQSGTHGSDPNRRHKSGESQPINPRG